MVLSLPSPKSNTSLPIPWIVNGVLALALTFIIALTCIWRKKSGKKIINPVKRLSKKIRPNNYFNHKRHLRHATTDADDFEALSKDNSEAKTEKTSFIEKDFSVHDEILKRVDERSVYDMASDVKSSQVIYENQMQSQSKTLNQEESPYVVMEPQHEFFKKQNKTRFG